MIHRLKRYIKSSLAYLLYYSGFLFLVKNRKLRNKAVVLMYHRVIPLAQWNGSFSHDAIIVDDINFDRQLRFLSRHFNIISSGQLLDHFDQQTPLPDASCLITFDDGWYDNYQYARPVLEKHSTPALIFIPTDYVDSGRLFWQEALGHGFDQCLDSDSPEAKELLTEHHLNELQDSPRSYRRDRINDYVRSLKSHDYTEIEDLLNRIRGILGSINFGDLDRYLGKKELLEMQGSVISFGSHACSHRILTRLTSEEQNQELSVSQQKLHEIFQQPVKTIAYPNGNFDEQVCATAKQTGYRLGFTTVFGYVSAEDDPYKIKRVNMNNAISRNMPLLLATILGVFNL